MHVLLWLDSDDPDLLMSGISADLPSQVDDPFLHLLVRKHQKHNCSAYCLGEKRSCKFGFPKPFVEKNIYDPFSMRYKFKRQDKDKNINCYNKDWLRLWRGNKNINCYNKDWLRLWRGNMDIKIISNDNVCKYVTKYCTKEEPYDVKEVVTNQSKNT